MNVPILIAFDVIAPMIGGVVLAGAFSFFGGVFLARRRPVDLNLPIGERSLPRLEEEIQRLNREQIRNRLEFELLSEFSGQGDLSSALSTLLGQIVPQSASGFAAAFGTGSSSCQPISCRGLSPRSVEKFAIPKGLIDRLRIENLYVVRRDDDVHGMFQSLDESDRSKSDELYLTALEDGNQIVGVVVSSAPWPVGLSPTEQRSFMKAVARKIGSRWNQMLATEQKTTELRLTQDMLELRALIDSRSDEPLVALEQFAKRLRELTNADRAVVYFVARRMGEHPQPMIRCGQELPPEIESAWNRAERRLANMVIDAEMGVTETNTWLGDFQEDSPITSSVTKPVRVNGRVLGALCLTKQGHNGSLDNSRKLVEFSAEMLSKTLHRVFDEAAIRRQARHDHLTDLVNRRSFDAYLTTEIERIQLGESPACSLILTDLDRFKSINDQYGHQAGDEVLRETARVLADQVSRLRLGERSIVARYGGEEFAILLPGVGLAGAVRIAEGIRRAVESMAIRIRNLPLSVTLSIGVGVCPTQASTAESLVAVADRELYRAKSLGRNCVCHPG